MARVDRPVGFRGGLKRWVAPKEARALAAELDRVRTCEGLAGWLASSPLVTDLGSATAGIRYRARLGALADPVDGEAIARSLIIRVAALRRVRAISSHASENRMRVPSACGSFGSSHSLARCPACDAPLDATLAPSAGDFYCSQHGAEQEADLDALL